MEPQIFMNQMVPISSNLEFLRLSGENVHYVFWVENGEVRFYDSVLKERWMIFGFSLKMVSGNIERKKWSSFPNNTFYYKCYINLELKY